MSGLSGAFSGKKAFIPFITCGYPSIQVTEKAVLALDNAGADIIELGIPFSDTTAEGALIQEMNNSALSAGITTDDVLQLVKKISRSISALIVLSTYANVVFSYGTDRFISSAVQCGAKGLILSDVPYEEAEEFRKSCDRYGMDLILQTVPFLERPFSEIAAASEGFAYCSSAGEDAEADGKAIGVSEMIKFIKKDNIGTYCAVDLDVRNADEAHNAALISDGVIVSCAFQQILKSYDNYSIEKIETLARRMRKVI